MLLAEGQQGKDGSRPSRRRESLCKSPEVNQEPDAGRQRDAEGRGGEGLGPCWGA